ncbi:MAG: hypothetical protein KDA95_06775 [Acidimicrobiales bacterium]|nr:hypothetical protein [Acidimicrobiales bacterium]
MAGLRPRTNKRSRLIVSLSALVLVLAGCAGDPPTEAEIQREQVETRLNDTFSQKHADCILNALDQPTMAALSTTDSLKTNSKAFEQYSNVVVLCTSS